MKKFFTLLMAVLMFASIHTTSVFAEGETGSRDNPEATTFILTQDGTPSLMSKKGPNVYYNGTLYIHFISGSNDYSYEVSRTNGPRLPLIESNLFSNNHTDVLPAGTYDVLLEKIDHNSNSSYWYKPTPTSLSTEGMFTKTPSANDISVTEDGKGGLNIACVDASDEVCKEYLQAAYTGVSTTYFIEYDGNIISLGYNSNVTSGNGIFTESNGVLNLSHFNIASYQDFEEIDEQDITFTLRSVVGFVGEMKKTVEDITIPEEIGTFNNPYAMCGLKKNDQSTEENAYIISCEFDGETILTNDMTDGSDNRMLLLYERNDQNELTGKHYSLDISKAVLSNKELYFDTTSFLDVDIRNEQLESTYLPAGNYDVYLQKMNALGQAGSGVYYQLKYNNNTSAPFTQIKNPAQEFTVTNDADNNILISCKDTDVECKKWLGVIKNEFDNPYSMDTTSITFVAESGDTISFFYGSPNLENLEYVLDGENNIQAIKIDGTRLASMGFKSENGNIPMLYKVRIMTKGYPVSEFLDFTPNVTLKDPADLANKLTLTQEQDYPFTITVTASDEASFEYLKNARFTPQKVSGGQYYGSFENGDCDESNLQCSYPALFSQEGEVVDVNLVVNSDGYELTFLPGWANPEVFNMKFIDTEVDAFSKVIFSTSGIQIFSDDVNFLKTLTGEIVADYPNKSGMELTIIDSTYNTVAVIRDNFIYGKEVQNDKTINYLDPNTNINYPLSYYVQVDNPELAEIDFDSTKSYVFVFTFPYDYKFGNIETNPISISNEYFRGLSEGGYTDMTDEENLDILGIILGMDATDNNPNTIKKIYKEVYKKGNTANLNIDMPEVVGAIIERENETGGFSKENLEYLDANQVELGITFDNLDEADLEEGFKKFDVEKTDVGFEVTLTNRYLKDGNELVDEADNITELPQEAVITFDLPDEELEEGKEYMLLTIHNGNPKLIKIKVEKDPTTGKNIGTALVSEFSPFMVVEVDNSTQGPTSGSSNNGFYYVPNTAVK